MLSTRQCIRTVSTTIRNLDKVRLNPADRISRDNILTNGLPKCEIPNITIQEFMDNYHSRYEKFAAIECVETKRAYTYGDLRTRSTNIAKNLRKVLKLKDGDVVGIVMLNQPEYPIAALGILKANLVTTTISPMYTPDEISKQLIDSDAKVLITEVELFPKVRKALEIVKTKCPILVVKTRKDQILPENTIDFHDLAQTKIDYPEFQPCDPRNVAFMPYSSGTTGLPKGVELTHSNLVSNFLQTNLPHEFNEKRDATESFQEEVPMILPYYHIFGYSSMLFGLAMNGVKSYTVSKFNPELFIRMLIEKRNISLLYIVPPLVLFLNNVEAIKKEYIQNVRELFCAAAPLAASDELKFAQKFGDHIPLLQGYGLSETSPGVASTFPYLLRNSKKIQGSVGIPAWNTEVKIVDINDPDNKPLPANKSGELLVRGPQVMKGYHNLPEETEKCFTKDNWFRTGDVAHFNDEGFIFITDRFKELIKVNAQQVPPAELEGIIRSFPEVLDAAVIGIPHDVSGEVPRAYVVPRDGIDLDIVKLNEYVNGKVAKYKQLQGGIVVVDNIPVSPSGKILRKVLRDEYLRTGN